MKKKIQVLILILVISNLSFSKSFAQDALVALPPEKTEQLERDLILYPKMREDIQRSIGTAIQVASKTGKSTTLDEVSVNELISMVDRLSNYYGSYSTYYKAMADSVLKCSQDSTLPIAEFKKCNQDFQAYSALARTTSKNAEAQATLKKLILSAQDSIDAAASSYLNSLKKLTISCIKGKSVKKVTGSNPKCPSGYKIKQ